MTLPLGHEIDALIEQRRLDEAAARCRAAIHTEAASTDHRCRMALIEFLRGHSDAAIRSADAAIAIDPRCEWAHRLRAKALLATRSRHDAEVAARIAVALRPDERMAREVHSDVLLHLGRVEDATAAAAAAVALQPNAPTAVKRLARAHERAGDLDEACRVAARGLAACPGDPGLTDLLAQLETQRASVSVHSRSSMVAVGALTLLTSTAGVRAVFEGLGARRVGWWEWAALIVSIFVLVWAGAFALARYGAPWLALRLDPAMRRLAERRASNLPSDVLVAAGFDNRDRVRAATGSPTDPGRPA